MAGRIFVGIGGWTFEPWRGVFYPDGLAHKRELEYASRKLTSIEINGTYYSGFKPETWAKWREETPDGFVFSVKASRFCTNRKVLADAKDSVAKFMSQGLHELGDRLGPINWQFMGTKKFDPDDFEGFLKLLPKELKGLKLRHALEVRHASFQDPRFYDLARKYGAAIVFGFSNNKRLKIKHPNWEAIGYKPTDDAETWHEQLKSEGVDVDGPLEWKLHGGMYEPKEY